MERLNRILCVAMLCVGCSPEATTKTPVEPPKEPPRAYHLVRLERIGAQLYPGCHVLEIKREGKTYSFLIVSDNTGISVTSFGDHN